MERGRERGVEGGWGREGEGCTSTCTHMWMCITPRAGEYMLHDGSDSEDSFTDDGEEREGGRVRREEEREEEGEREKCDTILPSNTPSVSGGGGGEAEGKGGGGEVEKEGGASEEEKGDPEMAPVYLKKMLPVLAELYHSSLAPTLR